jgi:hypothetical protein
MNTQIIALNKYLVWKTCIYKARLFSLNWKLVLNDCSQQVKAKQHLRMFVFVFDDNRP